MKNILAISLLFGMAFCASAKQLSAEEALGRIDSNSSRLAVKALNTYPTPAYTLTDAGFTSLYVFNRESKGYIIVSADDCAVPLLGYSDSETFDVKNIPSQLQWWLDCYAREIRYAAQNGITSLGAAQAAEDFSSISPLLTTQWDQSSPYNNDCPTYKGQRSVTGCVATAMAQAMKYHNFPAKGAGQNSYSWNGQTLSLNFADISFDWANMTDTYGASSTQAQKDAVAQLMYACGVSVNMNYSSSESGAVSFNIGPALYQYFGYSADMVMPSRAFFSTSDWQQLVYSQLAAGMPVLYGGQSNEGGHQFVCDGYSSDGYFHFNWGWSGMSDGYYLLSALDPISQGIGGSTSGFNYDQSIIANMTPASNSVSTEIPAIYCYGAFSAKSTSATLGSRVEFASSDAFYNFGVRTFEATLGIKLTDANGNVQYEAGSNGDLSFKVLSGYSSYSVTLPQSLASGTYTVSPAYKVSGSSKWMDAPIPLSAAQSIRMTVSNRSVSFSNTTPNVQVTDLSFGNSLYLDTNFKATLTIQNSDDSEYYAQLMMALFNGSGNEVTESSSALPVDVESGQTLSFDFITSFASQVSTSSGQTMTVQPGTYILALFDMLTGQIVYQYPQYVQIAAAPSNTELAVTSFGLADGSSVAPDPSAIQFSGSVECQQGYYADQLIVAVFENGATSTSIQGSTDYLFLNEGDSSSFTATVAIPGAQEGEKYYAVVFDAGRNQLSNPVYFTIGGVSSGIDGIGDDASGFPNLENAEVYTLDGVRVSGSDLAPGLYIVRRGGSVKKVMIGRQ